MGKEQEQRHQNQLAKEYLVVQNATWQNRNTLIPQHCAQTPWNFQLWEMTRYGRHLQCAAQTCSPLSHSICIWKADLCQWAPLSSGLQLGSVSGTREIVERWPFPTGSLWMPLNLSSSDGPLHQLSGLGMPMAPYSSSILHGPLWFFYTSVYLCQQPFYESLLKLPKLSIPSVSSRTLD